MLTIMSIEHEILDQLDFREVIRDVADQKLSIPCMY